MIPLVKPYIAPKKEMIPAIKNILYSGYIAEGEPVYTFEKEFGDYIGNPNILMVNSGTAALHICLLLLNVGAGDEIISTPMTSEPTNTTIALTGAKIVWADVDGNTGLISPKSIREKITNKTKAIMIVHYAGMICDLDEINKISEEYNIPVIEDAAHALGAKYKGKMIGSNSRFTCFSFQAIKHMTTVDGGAIAFKNFEDIAPARKLRWFGLDKNVSRLENDITRAGYKYGMNNLNATIGLIQMRYVKKIIDLYIENGKYYDNKLKNAKGVELIHYYDNTDPSYWLYTLKVDNRDRFIKKMEENGIIASPLHHRSDTHTVFLDSKTALPEMDNFYEKYVHIPCGWWVSKKTRSRIVRIIKEGW